MQSWRIAVLFFLFCIEVSAQQKFTISGYVKEAGSLESLPGVNVQVRALYVGTSTNEYGFYSLTLHESDSIELEIFMTGYERQKLKFALHENKDLNIDLQPVVKETKEVVVQGKRQQESVSDNPQMSTIDIPVSQIKNIPTLMGEKDVLKTLQLMPGVQKGSEGSAGIYVRGGGPDQNLLILDDAVVYNAQHLFGFFSVFNGDALKSVELTKGGFPARYGGRLSSVINMNMKDGNKEEVHGEAGIGLISSRLMIEGPLVKKKSSFVISGRRTYADLLIYPLLPADSKGGYFFYDFNAKANYEFSNKNKIYLSGYLGKDKFYFNDESSENYQDKSKIYWGNITSTFRWNHLFNKKLFMNTSAVFSTFNFNISNESRSYDETFFLRYFSRIRDYSIKSDLDYALSPKHTIKAGAIATLHAFTPQALESRNTYDGSDINTSEAYQALESGAYIEDIYKPHPRWIFNGGIRFSSYVSSDINYVRPEPRFTMVYKVKEDLSLKASYATMNQYLHLLSNTGIGLPTDLWVPSTDVALPETSWQVAGGMAKDFTGKNLALTVEGYYKETNNIISYKEGASFLDVGGGDPEDVNSSWENNITQGRGWSYGAEVLLQRKFGKFSGWTGYTLSWTWQQFDSLNNGEKFYARYDRRHDVSLVGIYKPSDKITFSAVWVYGTGNAVTMPTALVPVTGHIQASSSSPFNNTSYVGAYEERNNYRMPAYHRMDIGIQFHKQKERFEQTWDLTIYNVYSRLNAFYLEFKNDNLNYRPGDSYSYSLYKIALFPLIPSITYNIKF